MAIFKHIPVDQIQYLANAMFSKLKTWCDSSMSSSSTHPIQNKVVKAYVDSKFESTLSDVAFYLDPDSGCLYYKKTMNS